MGENMSKKGQLMVEYVVMFTVIVAVVLYASMHFVRPAVCRFFCSSTKIIDNVAEAIDNIYD